MARSVEDLVPSDTPDEVKQRLMEEPRGRVPVFDPTLRIAVDIPRNGSPEHRLVVIGDSLSHGFQSGAVFNTDISYPAIIAYELGWLDQFRYPRYPGFGGLPLNLEFLLRDLEQNVGPPFELWDWRTYYRIHRFMDEVENYWERGPGQTAPDLASINHCLAVYGWDLRDALERTAASCEQAIERPSENAIAQLVENANYRAAMRVYPHWSDETRRMTLFDAAAALGGEHDISTDCGIETLVVFLGSNNALQAITKLEVDWSKDPDSNGRGGFQDLAAKNDYTVWQPKHFAEELKEVVAAVERIEARHVIWCTVPHVTIAPLARGGPGKVTEGSRYYSYYTRPWVSDDDFRSWRDLHITDRHARAVDCAIDMYNEKIQQVIENARRGANGAGPRDWYLLDIAGLLDRLAARRYITDRLARPPWWIEYPLPSTLAALDPSPDSQFLASDGRGGRASGGLFSIDGVHPTTVNYGIVAQEIINIMQQAGVEFRHPNGTPRTGPVTVDFDRLLRRDTLVRQPPQNLDSGLGALGWLDETFGWVARALNFSFGR
jgi:hypothetical protein